VSRHHRPAIAGVLVAAVGAWLVFILNALSYIGILAVLVRWRRERRKSSLPAERFVSAIRVGLRFVTHTRALQIVLIRGSAFFVFASATWSLFPLIVRRELGMGPEIYGLLLTCIGIGAVGGALLLPRARARFSRDALVAGASALYAVAALMLGHVQNLPLLAVAMLATGVAWISILSALQVAAQMTLPAWVRARGLAAFVMVFMGGMALGSILWGQVAAHVGIPATLTIAAFGNGGRHRLDLEIQAGPTRGARFHAVVALAGACFGRITRARQRACHGHDRIPRPARQTHEFIAAMQSVREMRRRNGAYFWELFHDSADPSRFNECFMDESWVEHLRQHERVSVADREIQQRAKAFMVEGTATKSSHWLADRQPVAKA
jgi:hypothetical protein